MSIKLGVVGAGGIAGMHLQSLSQVKNADVTAITDLDRDACVSRQKAFGIDRVADDIDGLLASDIEAVLVCTPTFTHCDIVTRAARAGKHIFCEKPMARTLAEADQMIEACDAAGVSLMIGFVRRFCPQWGAFKALVEEGRIGRPVVWRMAFSSGGPASPWYLNRAQGAGPFLDGMVHNYDFCRYAFGEVADVQSSLVTLKHASDALDTGTAHMVFESGDHHVILGSWGLPVGSHSPGIHDAMGPDGVILFQDPDQNPEGIDTETHGYLVVIGPENKRSVHAYPKENMFLKEMQYFVNKIERQERPEPDGGDGRAALEIALRILAEV